MRPAARLLSLTLFASLLTQCGDLQHADRAQGEEPAPEDTTPEYRYRFRNLVNGIACDTGEHVFTDKLEYCRSLVDNRLNRDCALDARKEEFADQCQSVAVEGPH